MDIFDEVWRSDLTQPGFKLIDLGVVDSFSLRKEMLRIIEEEFEGFKILSLLRVDQQKTTRFHLDGGPDLSVLLLGYEPSNVDSQLFIADHSKAASKFSTPSQIIAKVNSGDESSIEEHIEAIPIFNKKHSYIFVVNNSLELGVLHKAKIINPDDSSTRIINSIMISKDFEPSNKIRFPAVDEDTIKNFLTDKGFL